MDEGKAVDVVYLEFSKALNAISHSILLEKLAARSLDKCTLCWVKNWLDSRAQRVVVNRVPSSWWPVTGVFLRVQYWGQLCSGSLSMIWMRRSGVPSISLQKTPSCGESVDLLEGRKVLQRNLDRQD